MWMMYLAPDECSRLDVMLMLLYGECKRWEEEGNGERTWMGGCKEQREEGD